MYFLLVIGLLYTTNLKAGFFFLEKKIYFLLVPLLVLPAVIKFHIVEQRNLIFRKIGYITFMSAIALLFIASYRHFVLHDLRAFTFLPGNQYEGFTSIHYVYYAMYFAVGSFLFVDSVFDDLIKKPFGLVWIAIMFVFSLGMMILVASKTGIIVYVIASAMFLYQKLINRKTFAFLLACLLICGFAFLYFNDSTRARFIGLSDDLSILRQDELVEEFNATGVNMRLVFWRIQLTNAWKDGLMLTGTGTGDVQDYIDSLYKLPKYQLYGYLDWDSHNQWVHSLIQLGITAPILLALLYYLYFNTAIRSADLKMISFLIITFSFSLSESILELNKGIVFFTLFFALLTEHNHHTAWAADSTAKEG